MQTPHPFPQIVRVALIDSQEVYRIGLRSLINKHPGFHVVAEFRSMSEALPATARSRCCSLGQSARTGPSL